MSDLLAKHPFRDQLCELFERGASLREISRMIGTSKTTVARLRDQWQREHPQVQPESKQLARAQARSLEMRERIEGLLEIATAKNDLTASVRLLAALNDLDRRILSPTSRRQPENLRVQIVYARPSDGAQVDARQYLSDATRQVGWRTALGIVLESMVNSGTVSAEIIAGMEFFIGIVEREDQAASENVDSESP